MRTDFVLDALKQTLHQRQPFGEGALVHHSDCGVQYVSIRYNQRLEECFYRRVPVAARREAGGKLIFTESSNTFDPKPIYGFAVDPQISRGRA